MSNKILIIANDFSTVYNFRLELLKALLSSGYSVSLALPSDERNSTFVSLGCSVFNINLSRFGKNPLNELKTMRQICRIIKKVDPLVVLTYTAKPNIYGGLAARRLKKTYICNITGLGSNFQKRSIIQYLMIIMQRIAYKKANVIFFQNESNLDFFISHRIIKDHYKLLPGSGVCLQDNPIEDYPNNQIISFITIARIRKDKGYDELFSVIKQLKDDNVPAKFAIVGWYEDERYKEVISELQTKYDVSVYGNIPHDKIHAIVSEFDCLIHPSHHEGMSNVVLEAAAAGRPCIVSDIHGCIECVDDSRTGFYFRVGSATDLYQKVKAMINLSKEERAEMGKAARKKIENGFDRQIVVDAYLNEIKRIEESRNETLRKNH